jgi:hypothetical protein
MEDCGSQPEVSMSLPDFKQALHQVAARVLAHRGVRSDQVGKELERLRSIPVNLRIPTDAELDAMSDEPEQP